MPFAIGRDRKKIWYDISGKGEPLVLIGGSSLSPDTWKAMHKALDVDLSKDLLRIRSPQLILIGDRGPLGKDTDYASGWKEVRRLNPDAKLIVINGAEGTFLVITHPAEVAKEVIGFLKKHKISA